MDNYAREAKFSSMPLLKEERMYGMGDSLFANTGYGVATWCFLTGGLLAGILSFKMALITALAGNLIGTLLVAVGFATFENVCYLTNDGCAYQAVLAQLVPALAHMYGLG